MEDPTKRARVLRTLIEMRKWDPKPLTAGDMEDASDYEFVAMDRLRRDLEAWGLITIEKTHRGRLPVDFHRLTAEGREAADLAAAFEAVTKRAQEKAKRRGS